jgi:regulator of protease activity HflC (stomatin/prohibitin superfamily)
MAGFDAMTQMNRDHTAREMQRMKVRAPVFVLVFILAGLSIAAGVILVGARDVASGIAVGVVGVILAVLLQMSLQLIAEWDRALILRFGQYRSVQGPGFFAIVPVVESVARVIDMRVRTATFYSEAMLTRDTVPVNIDAIAFWHVWDTKKAVLEVESYYQAIVLAVQTALRDIVGIHTLAEILSERDKIAETLKKILDEKTGAWGITVNSIEIRDISVPDSLRDALSKQAQAERERQSRTILGQAELEIAQKFAEAAKGYVDNPVALQLRAMNIVYEGIRAGGSMMIVPSSVLDTMNLGGLVALGAAKGPKAPAVVAGTPGGSAASAK